MELSQSLKIGPVNSCGLATIDDSTKRTLIPRLQAEANDNIILDAVRACVCGQKTIVYAYNLRKVNKLCLNCGAFESKESIVEG